MFRYYGVQEKGKVFEAFLACLIDTQASLHREVDRPKQYKP